MNPNLPSPSSSRCWASTLLLPALLLPACGGGGGGGTGGSGGGPGGGPRTAQTAVMLTADGARLVAAADDGSGTPVELSTPVFTRVRTFAVSPDGSAVAYVADGDAVDRFDLYVRELAGSAPVRVSALQQAFCDVEDFQWAPDGSSLVYRADAQFDDRFELFRVARDGSAHYRVQRGATAAVSVSEDYGVSPTGAHVFTVLRNGGQQVEVRLHETSTGFESSGSVFSIASGREVRDVRFSPDGQWLSFRSDHAAAVDQFEVWRRPVDLSVGAIRSNAGVGPNAKILAYEWSPDSLWLAEKVVHRTTDVPIGIDVWSIATDVGDRAFSSSFETMAWAPNAPMLAVATPFDPRTGSNGSALLLVRYDPNADVVDFVAAPPAGQTLRGDLVEWSPDGAHIAYATSAGFLDERAWIATPAGATPPVQAIDLTDHEVVQVTWSPDSARFGLLERDQTQAFHPGEWHVVGRDGRSTFRSGTFLSFATSMTLRWSADGARAVYTVDASAGGPSRLRSVAADGTTDVAVAPIDVGLVEHAAAALPQ